MRAWPSVPPTLTIPFYDGSADSHWKPHFTTTVRQNSFAETQTDPATSSIRPERGNLAAKYDPNAANLQKTLRRQFGIFYDVK
jgi:hypothetical protein